MSTPEWWLKERTFHHSGFSDVTELLRLKREQGLSISLCLPTLNEAKTIGRVIRVLKEALMEECPLLDEMGIVDSGSSDRTREIARRLGVQVFSAETVLPELTVRPFLNLLFPDLAVLAQPLSGEYAGRRRILERMPFFTGYGVETGLLIDIEQQYGIESIAQVDMDVRVHRNQSIESLRRMAYVILSVLMRRSEELGKIALLEGVGHELHLVHRDETAPGHRLHHPGARGGAAGGGAGGAAGTPW